MPRHPNKPRLPVDSMHEVDELFRKANPNPERLGCPSREVLVELAHHKRPIHDPWFDHLGECSECYREFQELRAQVADGSHARRWWFAAAALALVALCGWWLMRGAGSPQPDRQEAGIPTSSEVIVATVDLRRSSPLRGEVSTPSEGTPLIDRNSKQLMILLPVGSTEGRYMVELRDSDGSVRVSTEGDVKIEDFVATLHANVDLVEASAGSYRLAVRHVDESWREYVVSVE